MLQRPLEFQACSTMALQGQVLQVACCHCYCVPKYSQQCQVLRLPQRQSTNTAAKPNVKGRGISNRILRRKTVRTAFFAVRNKGRLTRGQLSVHHIAEEQKAQKISVHRMLYSRMLVLVQIPLTKSRC